jgi:transposase
MQRLGASEDLITKFMNQYVNGIEYLLFDVTDIISKSKNLSMAEVGYNSKHSFDPQINLLYMFSQDQKTPVYYRIFPGNISGMAALEICIKESKVNNALIVGDKGFLSYHNLDFLSNTDLKYVLPLKRNSGFIDYSFLDSSSRLTAYDNYFIYSKRPIFYKIIKGSSLKIAEALPEKLAKNEFLIFKDSIYFNQKSLKLTNSSVLDFISKYIPNQEITDIEIRKILHKEMEEMGVNLTLHDTSKQVVIFYDKRLEVEESTSYLTRLAGNMEDYSMDSYLKKEKEFGTLSMISNDIELSAEKMYVSYKTRGEIETVFDNYKNLLDADRTYMQSDKSLNAWMFINHLALMMYYKIFNTLRSKDYLKQMSVQDVILRLSKINAIKIDGKWTCSEINSKSIELLKKIGIDITEFKIGS